MVVVHPDAELLDDIAGRLKGYVLEELNVQSVVPYNDPLKYASLQAGPDFSVLSKRLGKSMGVVAKEVKAMTQEDIFAFEKASEVTVSTHCLKLTDIKIIRGFKRPDDRTKEEMDAAGDGDVVVILDLRQDESLFEAGVAREIVNRIQELRKKAALEPTDMVEVYFNSLDEDKAISPKNLNSQLQFPSQHKTSCVMAYSAAALSKEETQILFGGEMSAMKGRGRHLNFKGGGHRGEL